MSAKSRLETIKWLGFQIDEEMVRREYRKEFENIRLSKITEEDADRLHVLIECAEQMDAHPVEVASHLDWLDFHATRDDARNSGIPF